MKNYCLFFIMAMAIVSCSHNVRKLVVDYGEIEKEVSVSWGDSLLSDTSFVVPVSTPDSSIIRQVQHLEDSLRNSLRIDSLYKAFQRDSTNFRKATKIVNGGYNGWDSRYSMWLKARKELNLYIPQIK